MGQKRSTESWLAEKQRECEKEPGCGRSWWRKAGGEKPAKWCLWRQGRTCRQVGNVVSFCNLGCGRKGRRRNKWAFLEAGRKQVKAKLLRCYIERVNKGQSSAQVTQSSYFLFNVFIWRHCQKLWRDFEGKVQRCPWGVLIQTITGEDEWEQEVPDFCGIWQNTS